MPKYLFSLKAVKVQNLSIRTTFKTRGVSTQKYYLHNLDNLRNITVTTEMKRRGSRRPKIRFQPTEHQFSVTSEYGGNNNDNVDDDYDNNNNKNNNLVNRKK